MKEFKDISDFNNYAKLPETLSDSIQVDKYEFNQFLKQSNEITVDFYRVSMKKQFNIAEYQTNINYAALIFFISPKYPFAWKNDNEWSGFFLQFSKEWLKEHQYLSKPFLNYGQHAPLFLFKDEYNEFEFIYNQLINYYQKKEWNTSVFLSYIQLLFELVSKCYDRQFITEKSNYNRLVKQFQTIVTNYYKTSDNTLPNVTEIASKMNISANYLGDIVKHFTGKTAMETIQEQIMLQAQKLLKEKQFSISEIAYQLGYEYPNYFAKSFKKHFGISPTEYRNK